jgi:UTP-glucose-1-phosphate uridylyltransferase
MRGGINEIQFVVKKQQKDVMSYFKDNPALEKHFI